MSLSDSDITSAAPDRYHAATLHRRGRMGGGALDWARQPRPFKQYPDLPSVALPRGIAPPDAGLGQVLGPWPAAGRQDLGRLDLDRLSAATQLACGLTARLRQPDGEVYLRTCASAGALYPTELYVAPRGIAGLPDGLYHYDPLRHALTRLRSGAVISGDPGSARFFLTVIFLRSAWKYRERAYRYCLLDCGHVLENLTCSVRAVGVTGHLTTHFADQSVNDLLLVDPQREACLVMLDAGSLQHGFLDPSVAPAAGPEHALRAASRVAPDEADTDDLPEHVEVIGQAHQASAAWIEAAEPPQPQRPAPGRMPLPPSSDIMVPLASAALGRRSRRNFVPQALEAWRLTQLLYTLCSAGAARPQPGVAPEWPQVRLLIGQATGFTPGLYLLDRPAAALQLLGLGNRLGEMAGAALDQAWLANAAVHVLFTAPLEALREAYGPRSYRMAHLEAGRLGQRAYLAATALDLGACGIGAFYDDETAPLAGLGPDQRLLYLVAAGRIKETPACSPRSPRSR